MELSFTVKCNPPKQTAQSASRILKRSNGSFFIGKVNNKSKGELMTLLKDSIPETPFTGCVELTIDWCYSWRKSETKKNMAKGFKYCDVKPDADNLCKQFNDCLTRLGYWKDDSQVARLIFTKMWADEACIKVKIKDLE